MGTTGVLPESEKLFHGLMDAVPDALVVVNRDEEILLCNRQTENLFGYHCDELLGKPLGILLPERIAAKYQEKHAAYFDAPQVRPMGTGLELFAKRKDNREFPVEIALSPVEGGGRTWQSSP